MTRHVGTRQARATDLVNPAGGQSAWAGDTSPQTGWVTSSQLWHPASPSTETLHPETHTLSVECSQAQKHRNEVWGVYLRIRETGSIAAPVGFPGPAPSPTPPPWHRPARREELPSAGARAPATVLLRKEHAQPGVIVQPSDRTMRCDHRHPTVGMPALWSGYGEGWCSCLQRGKLRLRGPGTVVQRTWYKFDGAVSNLGTLRLRRGRQRRSSFPAPGAEPRQPLQLAGHEPRRAEPLSLFCAPQTGQTLHGTEGGIQLQPGLWSGPCPPAGVWCPHGAAREHRPFLRNLLEGRLFQTTATCQERSLEGGGGGGGFSPVCPHKDTLRRARTVDVWGQGSCHTPRKSWRAASGMGSERHSSPAGSS